MILKSREIIIYISHIFSLIAAKFYILKGHRKGLRFETVLHEAFSTVSA